MSRGSLFPDDLDSAAPGLVQRDERPLHARREMAQDNFRRGVYVQGGADQVEARRQGREPDAGEVAMPLELA